MNWIVPNKLLAFGSPVDHTSTGGDSFIKPKPITHPPEFFVPIFKEADIQVVIRTSKPEYDKLVFVNSGIKHYDLFFSDGSAPSQEIQQNFFQIIDQTEGAIAVHCKAGLGRTGTLMACYLIKTYGFTASEAISYCRLRRPGSIIGDQQIYLEA